MLAPRSVRASEGIMASSIKWQWMVALALFVGAGALAGKAEAQNTDVMVDGVHLRLYRPDAIPASGNISVTGFDAAGAANVLVVVNDTVNPNPMRLEVTGDGSGADRIGVIEIRNLDPQSNLLVEVTADTTVTPVVSSLSYLGGIRSVAGAAGQVVFGNLYVAGDLGADVDEDAIRVARMTTVIVDGSIFGNIRSTQAGIDINTVKCGGDLIGDIHTTPGSTIAILADLRYLDVGGNLGALDRPAILRIAGYVESIEVGDPNVPGTGEVFADIRINHVVGTARDGILHNMRVYGSFMGNLEVSQLARFAPSNDVTIFGNLDATVEVHRRLNLNVEIGGDLMRSFLINTDNGLAATNAFNSAATISVHGGAEIITGTNFNSYTFSRSTLGGGFVGVVSYGLHGVDAAPVHNSLLSGVMAGSFPTHVGEAVVIIPSYGPIVAGPGATPVLTIERQSTTDPCQWTNANADFTVLVRPNLDGDAAVLSDHEKRSVALGGVSGVEPEPGVYRVRPTNLLSDTTLSSDPAVTWASWTAPGCATGATPAYAFRVDPAEPVCVCDTNGGGLSLQDLFDFLTNYFAGSILADINGDGEVTVQDIFDYLACYFDGCP